VHRDPPINADTQGHVAISGFVTAFWLRAPDFRFETVRIRLKLPKRCGEY